MMTSRLTPASFDTRSSSFALPSGRMTALSKSNSASAANVTFSLVGAGGGGGGGGGVGAGGGGGGGGGGSHVGAFIRSRSHSQPAVQFGNFAPSILAAAARSTLQLPVRQHRPNGSLTITPRASMTYGLSRGSTSLTSVAWANTSPETVISAEATRPSLMLFFIGSPHSSQRRPPEGATGRPGGCCVAR